MAYKRKHPSKISEERALAMFNSRNKVGVRETAKLFGISENSLYTYLWSRGYTKSLKLTHDEFINRLSKISPSLSVLSQYESNRKHVLVADGMGIIYKATPQHLLEGKIPMLCSAVNKNSAFEIRSRIIHGDRYDYSQVNYIRTEINVDIICKIHGVFKQTPNQHLQGSGCPMCNKHIGHSKTDWMRFAKDRVCTIYLIEMFSNEERFIKVGITSLPKISDRFYPKSTPYGYHVIYEIKADAKFTYEAEKRVQKLFKSYRYKPLLKFGGDCECLQYDIKETVLSYFKMMPTAR